MTDQPNRSDNDLLKRQDRRQEGWQDNFDRQVVNELTDLINVPGEHAYTPERLRYYKNDTRVFLEYGTDPNYTESSTGHMLMPDPGMTLTLKLAERTAYPVGFDLWPSMAYRVNQPPQPGDAVGWGYGEIDLDNFDPSTRTWSGTTADGYFIIHTEETGLEEAYLIGARSGSVWDETRVSRDMAANVLSIIEAKLNWYDVGPAVFYESYTDKESHPRFPQVNTHIGAIANDLGKASELGSQRPQFAISQAAGNTGLELEAGSVAIKASGQADYQYKNKGHSMNLQNTNTTLGVYQVLGALRSDPARPTVKLRIPEFQIVKTPGASVNRTRVLFIAVSPDETNAGEIGGWTVPLEHNSANSVVQEIEVDGDAATPLVGPIEDDPNTDASGPVTANTMTNPGGYQLGRQSVTPEGQGSSSTVSRGATVGNRTVYDTDICLVLADCGAAGELELDVTTEQNS